jgi:hypothetical protein
MSLTCAEQPDNQAMTDLEAAEMRVRQEERAYPADRSAWSIPLVDCAVRVFDAKDRVIRALSRELMESAECNDCAGTGKAHWGDIPPIDCITCDGAGHFTAGMVDDLVKHALGVMDVYST